MLRVANKPIVLSVFVLNVVMLDVIVMNVVAPFDQTLRSSSIC